MRFGDALALFDQRVVDGRGMVAAATELLAHGVDPEPVVALASELVTPLTSAFRTDELVASARAEMNMPRLDGATSARRVTQGRIRQWLRGELTDRELVRWAHGEYGYHGPQELTDLVAVDDLFDELPFSDRSEESVRTELRRVADRILALPDPWS